jgi:hypothetical protein
MSQIVHCKAHKTWPQIKPRAKGDGTLATNSMSYSTALEMFQSSVIQYGYQADVRVDIEHTEPSRICHDHLPHPSISYG